MDVHLTRRWRLRLSPRYWARRVVFWSGAVMVALAAMGFAWASERGAGLFGRVVDRWPWAALVLCPLGLMAVVWLTRTVFPGAEGSGIPQTIAALAMKDDGQRGRVLSFKIACGKVMMTALGLCAGSSVGREGPTVQVGAALLHGLGHWLGPHRPALDRAFITAGGAAGIAAAFNTPLAGIVFAIEELTRSFEERTSGTVLSAVIVSGLASMAVLGNYAYFGRTNAQIAIEMAWRPVLVCGLAGGVLGGLFSRAMITFARGVPGRAGMWVRAHPLLFAASCGLVLAVIGWISGNNTYGTGYAQARQLLEGRADGLPATFGGLKFVANLVSYVSGVPGGIFAPSLAVGAGLGGNLAVLLPQVPMGAVVILGMTGYFVGVVQTPITAVIIVTEMTESPEMTLLLLATALLAFAVSRAVCPQPLYRTLAARFLDAAKAGRA